MNLDIVSRCNAGPSCTDPNGRLDPGLNENAPCRTTCQADQVSSASADSLDRQARDEFDETPEVRGKRVAALREQVRSGTYEIPVAQLVRILARLILRRR